MADPWQTRSDQISPDQIGKGGFSASAGGYMYDAPEISYAL